MGLNEVFKKVADIERNATELASHKIDLGTIEDIAYQYKSINAINNTYNKLDATVQKSIAPLNAAYKQIVINQGYAKKITPVLDKLQATLVKQANDLGVNYKELPAFKQLMETYSFVSQIDDSITNSVDAVKSIGK